MASGSTRPRSTSIATQQGSASAARLTHAIATTSRGLPAHGTRRSNDVGFLRIRHPHLDETLTLHRLGVYGVLGRSLKTTNGLESINALIEERCAKVDHWQNSSQRHRWLATALLDIEPRLRKVMGYRHLPRLRDALKRELKIDTTTSTKKAA